MLQCGIAALREVSAWQIYTARSTGRFAFPVPSPTCCRHGRAPRAARYSKGVGKRADHPACRRRRAEDPVRILAAVVRIRARRDAAVDPLLGHVAAARQPVARTRGRRQAAGAQVQVRNHRRRSRLRARRQLRAGADHPAARNHGRRHQAAVRDRRSAGRTRPRHRRLQGRLRGGGRAVRRPPGLLRHLLSRANAGPDAGGRHRRRSRIHPHRGRAPSTQPEARGGRQLPGRVGGDDAGRGAPGRGGGVGDQRRADVVLVGQRRRVADALRRGPGRRRVAVAAGERSGCRQVRRRPPGAELRASQSRQYAVGEVVPPVREHRRGARALPRVRALVGRLLPVQRRGDALDRQQPLRRQQARVRRGAAGSRPLLRPEVDQAADHRVRVDGRQHHAAAAGLQLDRRRVLVDRGDQGQRPDHRRPAARGHRPPGHLRVRQGREEGTCADRRSAEIHPAAAARPLRNAHRGDASPRR